jgi:drug/metabolite transporter (DMT)-like permease
VRILYSLLLVGVTAVWGWTFVAVQGAIGLYSVLGFLAMPFAIATAALAPFSVPKVTLKTLTVGAGIGLVLGLGYLLQTTGLLFTNPTNSGLITGLFVVFAPLANRLFFGVQPSRRVLVAVALILLGMVLLAGSGPAGPQVGDSLTLLCAGLVVEVLPVLTKKRKKTHEKGVTP